jgi:hypothetical protein
MDSNLPLRDIHLPPPISWWPPAPGWWALAALLFGSVILLAWLWRRHRKERIVRNLALASLAAIEDSQADARARLQQLAIVMRRTCLSVYPRTAVAGLTGEAWLRFLDQPLGREAFTRGAGALLVDGAYRPQVDADLRPLFTLCRSWLKAMPRHARKIRGSGR